METPKIRCRIWTPNLLTISLILVLATSGELLGKESNSNAANQVAEKVLQPGTRLVFQVTKAEPVEEQRDKLEQNEPTEPTNVISEKNESNSEPLPESMEGESQEVPLITSDVVLVGILMVMLAVIFHTSSSQNPGWKRFYKVIPSLLLCYLLPSLLTLFGLVDPEASQLPFITKRCLLPTSLILLTLCTDLRAVFGLGPKALIMFLTGTVGVVIGGPLAILIVAPFAPELVGGAGPEEVWRGLATVAGSWIGGGANMLAMKGVFEPSETLYSVMIAVDIFVAELWMIFLVLGVGKAEAIDRKVGADNQSVERLREKMEQYSAKVARVPSTTDLFIILGVGFGGTALCRALAGMIGPWIEEHAPVLNQFSLNSPFFWLIVLATTFGLALSFTRARQLEGAGASKLGTVCIYLLVATIGLSMDLRAVFDHPGLFLVGTIWMIFHILLLVIVGRMIRAPYFFLAVGSKANIGGAASAPVIAAAFHPSLAPVGVLLAVVGYALGTYAAYLSGILMQIATSAAI